MPILEISILVFYCTSCQSLETKFLPLKTFWTLFQIKTLVRMTDFFCEFYQWQYDKTRTGCGQVGSQFTYTNFPKNTYVRVPLVWIVKIRFSLGQWNFFCWNEFATKMDCVTQSGDPFLPYINSHEEFLVVSSSNNNKWNKLKKRKELLGQPRSNTNLKEITCLQWHDHFRLNPADT